MLAGLLAEAAEEIKTLIGASVKNVEVVNQVKRVATLISEISASAHEQTGGISQINQAITQLDHVTQQNAALVEEAAAAAESLNQQSARMVEVVSVFKLSSSGESRR